MVVPAEREEPSEVGTATVLPLVEVVRLGDRDVPFAAGDRTRAVHGPQRSPLVARREPTRAAGVEIDRGLQRSAELVEGGHGSTLADHHAVAVEHDGDEARSTGERRDGVDRHLDAATAVGPSSVVPSAQPGLLVDRDDDLGRPGAPPRPDMRSASAAAWRNWNASNGSLGASSGRGPWRWRSVCRCSSCASAMPVAAS